MRLDDIEFRRSSGYFEIIKWQGETCYTVAIFERKKEGYDMRTIGDRFFKDHNAWVVGKHAIQFLNDIFDIECDD